MRIILITPYLDSMYYKFVGKIDLLGVCSESKEQRKSNGAGSFMLELLDEIGGSSPEEVGILK